MVLLKHYFCFLTLRKLSFLTPGSALLTERTLDPYLTNRQKGFKRRLIEHWGFWSSQTMTQVFSWKQQQLGRKQELDKRIDGNLPSKWEEKLPITNCEVWNHCVLYIHYSNGHRPYCLASSPASELPQETHFSKDDPPCLRKGKPLFVSPFCPPLLSAFSLCSSCMFCNPLQCSKGQWNQSPIRVPSQVHSLLNCIFLFLSPFTHWFQISL